MITLKNRFLIVTFLLLIVLSGLFAGGQKDAEAVASEPGSATGEVIIDYKKHVVPVPAEVNRIVSLNSGLSVLVGALGMADAVVGRDSNSTFPHALKKVYVVGQNSSSPNIELILEKRPDLVLADGMLPAKVYEQLSALGISVGIFTTSDPRKFEETLLKVGKLTHREERAADLLKRLQSDIRLVKETAAEALDSGVTPQYIFFENRKPYSSASSQSGSHFPIAGAGGINIAADEPVRSPKLSAEFVLEKNPDVIVRRMSGDGTPDVMNNMRDTIIRRAGLEDVRAVQDHRVYIIKADLFLLLRYPVGMAYMASWFYPDAFTELDPEEFHKELIVDLFGAEEWDLMREVFVYP